MSTNDYTAIQNSLNSNNFGIARGRLTRDPVVYTGPNGSRTVYFSLATANNFKLENGKVSERFTSFIDFKVFLPAAITDNSVYDTARKGAFLNVHYTVKTNSREQQELDVKCVQLERFAEKNAEATSEYNFLNPTNFLINLNNFGIARGKLTCDPIVHVNKDGSRSVLFTLAAYRANNDTVTKNCINFKVFIPAEEEGNRIYDIAHQDDVLNVQYTVQRKSYEKDGKKVFVQEFQVEGAQIERFAEKNAETTVEEGENF